MKVDNNNNQSAQSKGHESVREQARFEKNLSAAHEKRMKEVQKNYEQQLEVAKERTRLRLAETDKKNAEQMDGAQLRYKQELKDLKDILDKAKMQLTADEEMAKHKYEDALYDQEATFRRDYERLGQTYNNAKEDFSYKTADDRRMMVQEHQEGMNKATVMGKNQENDLRVYHKQKLEALRSQYNSIETTKKGDHENNLKRVQAEQNQELNKAKMDHERRLFVLKKDQQKEYDIMAKRYAEYIKTSESDFKEKYSNITKTNHDSLNLLKTMADESVVKLKQTHAKKYTGVDQKIKDEFYHMSLLQPTVKDAGREIQVIMDIPDYDKNLLQVSAHEKQIKMTFTRQYEDAVEAVDGNEDRYSHVESYTKFFKVDTPIDHRGITRTYQDGKVIFHLPKLVFKDSKMIK